MTSRTPCFHLLSSKLLICRSSNAPTMHLPSWFSSPLPEGNHESAETLLGGRSSSHAAMYVTRSTSAPSCFKAGALSKRREGGVVRAALAKECSVYGNVLILLRNAS